MRWVLSEDADSTVPSATLPQRPPAAAGWGGSINHAELPALYLPTLTSEVLDRPRITALLEESIRASRITVLLGPPGSGKTTSAALWARQSRLPVVWLNAEESAGEAWEFYADLVDELQFAAPRGDLSALLGGVDEPRPLRRMGIALARELHRYGTAATVVVDHADELDQEALNLIEVMASRLPTLRWVLLAVTMDPEFISHAETYVEARSIDTEVFELTRDEALSVLRAAGLPRVDPQALPESSSPLMVRSLISRAQQDDNQQITAETVAELTRDLTAQSLRRIIAEKTLPSERLPFLLTALSQQADAELLTELLQQPLSDAQQALETVARHGLGSIDSAGMLHTDRTLADGLREIAAEHLSAAELHNAHQTLCDWHLKHNRPATALHHAEQANDWERISHIMLLHFTDFTGAARQQAGEILLRTPCEMLRSHPWMGWMKLIHLHDTPGTTLTALQAVAGRVLDSLDEDADGLDALVVDGVKFIVHRTLGDFETSDAEITELLPQIDALQGSDVGQRSMAISAHHLVLLQASENWQKVLRQYAASSKLFLGEYRSALSLIEPIADSLHNTKGQFSWRALYSIGLKALILAMLGHYAQARQVLAQVHQADLPPGWDESHMGTPACIASAHLALVDRRPETARVELERLMHYQGTSELWPFILELRIRISYYFRETGTLSYTVAQLHARQERPPTSRFMQIHLQTRAASAAMVAGALPNAVKHLDQAKSLDYPGRPGVGIERTEVVLGLYRGDWHEVIRLSTSVLDECTLTPREEINLRMCRVHAQAQLLRDNAGAVGAQALKTDFLTVLGIADEAGSPFDLLLIPPQLLLPLLTEHAPQRTELMEAVRVRLGYHHASASQTPPKLTDSERRVLQELAHTDSRPVIAHRLYLSENTVKTHLRKIYRKMQAHSREEVLEIAYASGLLRRSDEDT